VNEPPPLPEGFAVGHWSDPEGGTGCTVILPPPETRGGVCVHGGGPGTRETDTLRPLANSQEANAVLITGGSAFGLAAADGVVRWLEEHDRGYVTPYGRVPLVPAAVIYDLPSGTGPAARPGPDAGYAACEAAAGGVPERGGVGAGTGATVGKILGRDRARPGGVGYAALVTGSGHTVAAVAAVNAAGDVIDEDGSVLAGPTGEGAVRGAEAIAAMESPPQFRVPEGNSTPVCVCTDASLDKRGCSMVARAATAGLGRAVDPVFTPVDGDVVFCLASGKGDPDQFAPFQIGAAAASVTAASIRDAVRRTA
jgi:L-aminopeptidase/D-esterase-like protein